MSNSTIVQEAEKLRAMADAVIKRYDCLPKPTEGVGERAHLEQLLYQTNVELRQRILDAGLPLPYESILG